MTAVSIAAEFEATEFADWLGHKRRASQDWTCTCAAEIHGFEITRHCEHGWSRTRKATKAEADAVVDRLAGTPCHGGKIPADERFEISAIPNPNHRDDCLGKIPAGSRYFEYVGDAPPYQSGTRYCARCALATWKDVR